MFNETRYYIIVEQIKALEKELEEVKKLRQELNQVALGNTSADMVMLNHKMPLIEIQLILLKAEMKVYITQAEYAGKRPVVP